MMTLYELVEGLLELLGTLYDTGVMTEEEKKLFDKYETVWYTYYDHDSWRGE